MHFGLAFPVAVAELGSFGGVTSATERTTTKVTMRTLTPKRIGAVLAFGAIIIAVVLQVFTHSFISVYRSPDGRGMIEFHWPVFVLALLHLIGLVCLAWPSRKQRATAEA